MPADVNMVKDNVLGSEQPDEDVLLSMRGIEIQFPGVKALDRVDFTLRAGEIHALLGENGAGKSTLIKCLTGVHHMDAGEIVMNGEPLIPENPQKAIADGISTVFQEVNLCPNLTVAENIFAGRQPTNKFGAIDWKTINNRSRELMKRFHLDIDVTRPLDTYSTAIQQMVSIARAVDIQAKVLILDEPTSSLDDNEVQLLFDVMRELKADGIGIIFITHFLDQVFAITDRITVLRNGRLVGVYDTAKITKLELVTQMIGKDMDAIFSMESAHVDPNANVILETENTAGYNGVHNINFQLQEGELLGFAGLLGSGRTETAQLLFGIAKPSEGTIRMNGKTAHFGKPSDAIDKGIAFCPEDRKKDGIIGDLSIRENIALAVQARRGFMKPLSRKEQNDIAQRFIEALSIATPDAEKKVGELSGGNQQKVILARWMATDPRILILDEPTRGIDVGAKAEIQRLMLDMCEEGVSVVFISSELDEIIRCSSSIVIMRDREMVAEIPSEGCTQQTILNIIAEGAKQEETENEKEA